MAAISGYSIINRGSSTVRQRTQRLFSRLSPVLTYSQELQRRYTLSAAREQNQVTATRRCDAMFHNAQTSYLYVNYFNFWKIFEKVFREITCPVTSFLIL